MTSVEPVLKWVGGKRSTLSRLAEFFPPEIEGEYFEPFLGGGAVAFSRPYKRQRLSDSNGELITLYSVIRDNPEELIETLKTFTVSRESYYEIRSWDRLTSFGDIPEIRKAARTYYLNRCGFNGLFRVNSRGEFNVPFGHKTSLSLDEKKIWALASKLRGQGEYSISLSVNDFESAVQGAKSGDCVYLDPPYVPISATSNFVSYAQAGFTDFDHARLSRVIESLSVRGVLVIMSNSNSKQTHQLFGHLGTMTSVPVRRLLSAKPSSRTYVDEVIFTNAHVIGVKISE